ncbi:MAG TPA: hypothetical protein VGX23_22970 [Actinocrinis sp.]|nr:hypothetical protein [Actinocrinis sp.]
MVFPRWVSRCTWMRVLRRLDRSTSEGGLRTVLSGVPPWRRHSARAGGLSRAHRVPDGDRQRRNDAKETDMSTENKAQNAAENTKG